MSKSIMSFLKKKQKEEAKELQNRANQFMAEYRVIRARYRCDLQAYLKMIDGGQGGIVPGLRIIDATKQVKAEEEAESQIEKNKNKDNGK